MKFSVKLSILLLSITISAIAIVSLLAYTLSHKALEKEIYHEMQSYAAGTLDTIDRTLFERFADMKVLATDSIISSPESTPKQITARLIEFRNKCKTYASLSFFDLNRIRIADTTGLHIGEQHDMVKYWEDVLEGKISVASDIRVAEELNIAIIYFASPVKDKTGATFGIVAARMPLSKLHDMIAPAFVDHTRDSRQKPEGLEIDLIDADGLLLYSNYNRKGILKDNLLEHKEFKAILAADEETIITIRDPLEGDTDFCVHAHEHGHLDFPGSGWTLMVRLPVELALAPVIQLRNAMAAVSIAIVVIAIAASLIFSRTISKPITKLRDAAAEIGKGRLDTKIESTSKDEIGQLAASFNQMTENLQKSTTSIENLNAANQQLQANEQQLKAANQQLKEFIYVASHDLREPVRKISSFGQLLTDSLAGKLNDDEQENFDYMIDGANRMQQMIEALLTYSRVTTKDIKFEEIDLNETVEQIRSFELAVRLEETGGCISVPEPLPIVRGDPAQIRQLLQNFIGNALKYHKKEVVPEVTIRAHSRENGMVRIEIEDNGIGIKTEQCENVFVMFKRLHSGQEYDGTGIGLAVCKKIVERHRGKIGVSSTYGQGSTFWFQLPVLQTSDKKQMELISSCET